MEIVINHLTRMGAPRICVAGIDPRTNRHVRPVTIRGETLTSALLDDEGGPFGVGVLVDLGEVDPTPSPPETEDHRFAIGAARAVERLSAEDYIELLDDVAENDLESIFGAALERHGGSYAVDEHQGTVSLGVLRPQSSPDMLIDGYGTLRLRLNDVGNPPLLPVTDIRFFEADLRTTRRADVDAVNARLSQDAPAFLMVGLARSWQKPGDDRPRHWLQVNGVCLLEDPFH